MADLLLDRQARCGCGWKGKKWYLYMNARDELLEHANKAHKLDLRVVQLEEAEADHG